MCVLGLVLTEPTLRTSFMVTEDLAVTSRTSCIDFRTRFPPK